MRSNKQPKLPTRFGVGTYSLVIGVLAALLITAPAHALNPTPIPTPKSSSYGLEATKTQSPPETPPTISTPGSGASYGTSPITVSGVCQTDLLVQVYNNGVLAGSIICTNGSYTLQVTLYLGQNDLTAFQYDDLEQASPISNSVSVTYTSPSLAAFGTSITLTSNYGRRAANPGSTLTWPLILAGGSGPYAFSIDWGDGTSPELKSQPLPGEINISHVYKQAGLYKVTVKVTDVNGVSAFIQLTAVANGQPAATTASDSKNTSTTYVTKVMWFPAVIVALLLLPTYWIGRRSQLVTLHRKLEKEMAEYKEL
jgi:hypothetical protein